MIAFNFLIEYIKTLSMHKLHFYKMKKHVRDSQTLRNAIRHVIADIRPQIK